MIYVLYRKIIFGDVTFQKLPIHCRNILVYRANERAYGNAGHTVKQCKAFYDFN